MTCQRKKDTKQEGFINIYDKNLSSLNKYKSGEFPIFTIGEPVIVRKNYFYRCDEYLDATITKIIPKSITKDSEFKYEVRYKD